jgi:hypothetical protein
MGMNDQQDQIEGCVRSRGECELTAASPRRRLDRPMCPAGDPAMFRRILLQKIVRLALDGERPISRLRERGVSRWSRRLRRGCDGRKASRAIRRGRGTPSRTMKTKSVAPEPSSSRFGYGLIQKRTQDRGAWRGRQLRPRDVAVERRTAVNQSHPAGWILAVLHGFDAVISDCAQ